MEMTLVVNEEREKLATVIRSLSVQNPIDGMKQLTSDCNEGLKSSLVACKKRHIKGLHARVAARVNQSRHIKRTA